MANKFYTISIIKDGIEQFISSYSEYDGNYYLGERPIKFTDLELVKTISDSKNMILKKNGSEERFVLREVEESSKEIPVFK